MYSSLERMCLMAENWLSKLNGNPLKWMLDSSPWTRYGTLTDLMGYPRDGEEAAAARMQVATIQRCRN